MHYAVKFSRYGHSDVLEIVDVQDVPPGPGEVQVAVQTAGINPGEIAIREGAMDSVFPANFPEGQGSDFAGIVSRIGEGVSGVKVGDEVIGMSEWRSAQAQYVTLPQENVVPKPGALEWMHAGCLYVAAVTADACIDAVGLGKGDTVVVSGVAGGVGIVTAQYAVLRGATVIGTAAHENHAALRELGITPVEYGDGQLDRILAIAPQVDAFIDTHGQGNIDLALQLGVASDRINTIIDFDTAKVKGVKANGMTAVSDPRRAVSDLADLIAQGAVKLPIRKRYPIDQVADAYDSLASGHGLGKIVLFLGVID